MPQNPPPCPERSWATTAAALLLGATLGGHGAAATLIVGEGLPVASVAQAARLARDGDTILILPGVYRGDVAVWTQRSLEIRGGDPRPVFDAAGRSAEGKGIWVFRNGDFRVENIEFRGARVPDGNGAGIRFERGRMAVRNCRFDDNENGILTGNDPGSVLVVEDSEFSRAPRTGPLNHLIYAGRLGRFTLRGSHVHGGYSGHLVKSRARVTELLYNLILDGPTGEASYAVDLPNGGEARLVGNTIGQGPASYNPTLVSYGAEGKAWPISHLLLSHNTLINSGWRPALFVHARRQLLPPDATIVAVNNLTVGLGLFTLALDGLEEGNVPLPGGVLDPATLDIALAADSWLRGWVAPADSIAAGARPTHEFTLPAGTRPLPVIEAWAPGAFQSPAVTIRAQPASLPAHRQPPRPRAP